LDAIVVQPVVPTKPPTVQPLAIDSVSAASERAVANALGDLGLAMLRGQSAASGNGQANVVASPLSLASALGLAHAGSAGQSARELALLLSTATSVDRVYARDYPAVIAKIDSGSSPLTMVNRVWVDQHSAAQLTPTYAQVVQKRFASDAATIDFSKSEPARQVINAWISKQTAGSIQELLPTGALTSQSRLVLTNAVHFKSPWQQPFDAKASSPMPFFSTPELSHAVPTMHQNMLVRTGMVGNATVLELPFAGEDYNLLIAMPSKGHTLNAFETDLSGADMEQWQSDIKPTNCRVDLPKFTIAPKTVALKASLQALGVQTVFGKSADFSPMLGNKGKDIALDNVYQAAGVMVDERGGEAVAATAAVAMSKSMVKPQTLPDCVVNRPFLFSIVHKATGLPVFIGKIVNPVAE
jgi:serpin B